MLRRFSEEYMEAMAISAGEKAEFLNRLGFHLEGKQQTYRDIYIYTHYIIIYNTVYIYTYNTYIIIHIYIYIFMYICSA